jgi:hypothetical protein
MFFIIMLVFFTAYLGMGAKYSRSRYANMLHQSNQQRSDVELRKKKAERLNELQSINFIRNKRIHDSRCDQHTFDYILQCSCGNVNKIQSEAKELRSWLSDSPEPPSVVGPFLGWPFYALVPI